MAMDFVKKQIMYAIKAIMEEYDVEDVDFITETTKPFFSEEYIGHEVTCIYKPTEDLVMEISYIPSFAFTLKHKEYKPTEFTRLKVLENLFLAVYNKLVKTYGIADYADYLKDAHKALIYYTEQAESYISKD